MDKNSFLAGLERAAEFHDEQAHLLRLAAKAQYPTEYRAGSQMVCAHQHDEAAKMIRGIKTSYELSRLELPTTP